MPPAYRYNIKQWSLEGKKNYYIAESPEHQGEGIRFSDLLGKALNGWIDPFYFVYQDESGDDHVLPYTYHLFDDTSRGLNNVYNVLNDIIAKEPQIVKVKKDPKREYLEERKLLLDTIIAAKRFIISIVMIYRRRCLWSAILVRIVRFFLIMWIQ